MSIPAICCRRRHSQPQSDGVNMYRHINVQKGGKRSGGGRGSDPDGGVGVVE